MQKFIKHSGCWIEYSISILFWCFVSLMFEVNGDLYNIISYHFTQARGPKCLPFKWFKCSVTQKRTLHKIPEPKRFSCRYPKQLRLQTCFRACLLFTRLLSIYLLFTISGCSLGIGDQRILWLMVNSLWLFFTQLWSSFKNILPYNTPFYNY